MKILIVLLLALNVFLFFWGKSSDTPAATTLPEKNADHIVIVKTAAAAPVEESDASDVDALPGGCYDFGPIPEPMLANARYALRDSISYEEKTKVIDIRGWRVLAGNFYNIGDAVSYQKSLTQQGFSDTQPIKIKNGVYAVSLGVFKTEASAHKLYQSAASKIAGELETPQPIGTVETDFHFSNLSSGDVAKVTNALGGFPQIPFKAVYCDKKK